MTRQTDHSARRAPRVAFVPVLATAVLLILALTARPGLAGLSSNPNQTATPTRTPRVVTALPAITLVDAGLKIPTATSLPTPAPTVPPTPTAAPTATTVPMTAYLAEIIASYQMDIDRRFVVVDPDRQLMTVWEPGQPLREFPISTGDQSRGYRTPAWYGLIGKYWGTFQAFGVYADEGWYLYEDAGSILVHGAPYTWQDGVKLYQGLDALGNYPASRGCIRLRPEDAAWFTRWNPQGVPLVVLPHRNA